MAGGDTKQKPTIDVVKPCPCCKKKLRIRHYRRKTSKPMPAEYDVWTEIEPDKQLDLGLGQDEPTEPGTKVTPAGKKKPAKKKTVKKRGMIKT